MIKKIRLLILITYFIIHMKNKQKFHYDDSIYKYYYVDLIET